MNKLLMAVLALQLLTLSTKVLAQQGAVVELFTSEGCSSCPPAEAVMQDLQKEFGKDNVLFLSFHVDYWDRLGWKDPFSSHAFTERQERYSELFRLNSIYTPQTVINGLKETVGSNRSEIEKDIRSSLGNRENRRAVNGFKAVVSTNGLVEIKPDLAISSQPSEKILYVLVQKRATTAVKRGENEGLTLIHTNIVRGISEGSHPTFSLPDHSNKDDYFVAVLIENEKNGEIVGWESIELGFVIK